MLSSVMPMSTNFQHPGHLGPPPPHSQMHSGPMMFAVGCPGGFPGIQYGSHGPLTSGPMSGCADRSEHSLQPGQAQLGGPIMQQHHHGPPPPGLMNVPSLGPHPHVPSGSIPTNSHAHHLHHPAHGSLAMPRGGMQLEFRIYELNKRLQQRSEENDGQWWEAFANDFFEDDATITIIVHLEDGPKHFHVVRTLIPRYFRSIFESGCSELYFNLRHTRESFQNPLLILDSDCANMVMNIHRPFPTTVVVEAQFTLGLTLDEFLRIRSWTFQFRSHRELIMRSMLGIQDPAFFEQVSKNITRSGIMAKTLHFLRLCVILEPMQELMSRQKYQNLSPRECLRSALFQRWKRISCMPNIPAKVESNRQTNKRRKRKGSSANSDVGGTRSTKRKHSPVPMPTQSLAQPGDIMIVGEPTLMGGDFGEDDERLITRLENSQYDPAAALAAQHQQMAAMGGVVHPQHHPPATSSIPIFSRPPAFNPALAGGGGQSPVMYAPAQAYASPTISSGLPMKPQQSPVYGHPNSVPTPHMPYGVVGPPGGPLMPASVPPHAGSGRIMSPIGLTCTGNPSTPVGPGGTNMVNASMILAPPPSLANSEPGGNGVVGQQPPRSNSASSLYFGGGGGGGTPSTSMPAFPPPPQLVEGLIPPSALQQQQNGPPIPFQGQKTPDIGNPGASTAVSGSLQFPPLMSAFDSPTRMGGRALTPRLQQPGVSGHQMADGVNHQDIRSETPNPNGFLGPNVSLLLGDATLKSTSNTHSSSSLETSLTSQSTPNASEALIQPPSSCQDLESSNFSLPLQQAQTDSVAYHHNLSSNPGDRDLPVLTTKLLPNRAAEVQIDPEQCSQLSHPFLTSQSESAVTCAMFLDSAVEMYEGGGGGGGSGSGGGNATLATADS